MVDLLRIQGPVAEQPPAAAKAKSIPTINQRRLLQHNEALSG